MTGKNKTASQKSLVKDSYNKLSLAFLKNYTEKQKGQNVVFSPYSVMALLLMLADATDGASREEILASVCKGAAFEEAKEFICLLEDMLEDDGSFCSANAVCVKKKYKAEYIGDYKGSNVYAGFPGSGKDSPVLILWNREETQVVSGKQTAEILNTILDLNNREYERIDGVFPGYAVCFEMKNGLAYKVDFHNNSILAGFCTEFIYKWDPYAELPDRMPEHEIEKAKKVLQSATNMWGLEKNDKKALNHKVEMLIRSKNYKEWLKKNVKKRKPEPVRTDKEACTIINSMIPIFH